MSNSETTLDPIHALFVEDDERLGALVSEFLAQHGVLVSVARDGHDGLGQAMAHRFDVVLLDLMLPGLGGMEVCARLREKSDVPILMVSALGSDGERVLGLESGADDYICKPFSSPELLARIRAIVRRRRGILGRGADPLSVGALDLDPASMSAMLHARRLPLTDLEFELLLCFARQEGRVLSRERILELVHGTPDSAFDRSVDGHISRLRRKLGDDPRKPSILRTARRAGYFFVAPKRRD